MPALNQSVEECLSATGPLAGDWPGYRVREEQVQLAVEVEKGLAEGLSMALEASTGTGKTLSYLLPALLSRRRVILSVGNLTLQDHLWLGEYQKLRTVLPQLRQLTVLKGCDNYFCHHRFQLAREGRLPGQGQTLVHQFWAELSAWLIQTRSGEIQTLPLAADQISELSAVVTLGADQCLGHRCSHFADCYFQKARQQAAQADLLLINHTLLLSDQRLFEKGMGALLPAVDCVIVDEAHQLPELLIRRNTETIEEYRLQRWIQAVRRQTNGHLALFPALPVLLSQLEKLWQLIRHQLQQQGLDQGVKTVAAGSFKPLEELLLRLREQLSGLHVSAVDLTRELRQLTQWIELLQQARGDESVLYCDLVEGQLKIVAARLQNPFTSLNSDAVAWIFLSATLTVDGCFEYFTRSLELSGLQTRRYHRAMDYEQRAMLWVPANLPLPSAEDFFEAWTSRLLHLAQQLDGGILALFSSHQALQASLPLMQECSGRTVLVYEPGVNRHRLLQQFRQQTNSILLATGSFWEGIDVQGAALRCVAIDKLPFAAPDDVVSLAWKYKAGLEQSSVFSDYMVPHAVTRLRQGVGRLLRATDDCGLVMLGDRRVLKKTYGIRFLQSLPPMPLTESEAEVAAFLSRMGITRKGASNEFFSTEKN